MRSDDEVKEAPVRKLVAAAAATPTCLLLGTAALYCAKRSEQEVVVQIPHRTQDKERHATEHLQTVAIIVPTHFSRRDQPRVSGVDYGDE